MVRKKEFTSFDVAAVVRELKESVVDARVSNVYMVDSKTLLFKLHKPEKPTFGLILESGKRLHLTSYIVEKPSVPPAFCMALRKYLRNGWLIGVEQVEFERVVVFSFKTRAGVLRLVLELFGDGNIILVSDKEEILHALTYKQMRDRNVVRGEKFVFAPSSGKNPFEVGREDFRKALKDSDTVEVVRGLVRLLSIGGLYAEEVLLRTGVEKTKPCNTLSDVDIDAVFDGLQSLLANVSRGKLEPCIVLDETGGFVDVLPLTLRRYEGSKLRFYENFSEALDEYYVGVAAVEKTVVEASVETGKLKREADRLKRIIASQEKVLIEAEGKAERDKHIGDVIYAHIGEFQILVDRFLTARKEGKDWQVIVSDVSTEKEAGANPWTFFESFDPKGLIVNVSVDDLRFGLNLRETLFNCAGEFYERSKRSRQKLEGVKAALADSQKKLVEIEAEMKEFEVLERVEPSEAMEKLDKRKVKRKEWFEKFRWFVSSDEFLVVAGKDAVSNEVLVKKHTEAWDAVFHADVAGAPFVVIKTEGKEPSEVCLHEAAEFAVAFSRGWRESFASADVYWVKPEQLSKTGPSGEYVSHGAFVVSGKRSWMRNVLLKVAVGIVVNEETGELRFVGGPIDAVRAKAKAFVVVVPGDQSGKELFKRILKVLAEKASKENREKVAKASIEEIRDYIPYGKGRVLER